MAEEEQGSDSDKKNLNQAALDIESQIKDAMHSRVAHFKEQSDSLTFEGVRRLLEKDLGLEIFALDVHKRFIKQCLLECLDGAVGDNASKMSGETGEKEVCSARGEATAESPDGLKSKKEIKEPSSEGDDKMEDSPVLGLLTGKKNTKSETDEIKGVENNVAPSESTIKKAILKRASYIGQNSEKITMAGVRRFLEQDLKLEKKTLDPYKKFISEELDKVLKMPQVSAPAKVAEKRNLKKNSHTNISSKISSKGISDSSEDESGELEKEEVKPKKKNTPQDKVQNSEEPKKRKRPSKETKVPIKKQKLPAETTSGEDSDAENGGNVSEDGHSQSSGEKPVKKKEVSTPAYGKRVDHLKSVIKLCGMSVPPSVYRKVKQAPENKREVYLIKELEEILSKEGLSSSPSEKEIKEVRKKKERAKELEGIDMSNIVASSRRRSTASYIPPPKPKIPVESEGEDDDDDDDAEDTENEDDDDADDDEDDNDNDDGDDDNQSEEFNEDDADSD